MSKNPFRRKYKINERKKQALTRFFLERVAYNRLFDDHIKTLILLQTKPLYDRVSFLEQQLYASQIKNNELISENQISPSQEENSHESEEILETLRLENRLEFQQNTSDDTISEEMN